jgi:serine/threonine protein kinase
MTSSVQTDKTTICGSCRGPNTPGARFCNNCGAILTQVELPADADTPVRASEVKAEVQTPPDPLIGRIIEGKYRLDSLIGAGGMGAVYGSHRLLIGDEVAIKILHTERVVDPHASERFSREARAAARLKHPNAVSIYDFGVSSDGLQYLVMELIEGKSLREFAKQHGPLDAFLAAEVTSQVCAALDEAHRQHIVHRDIKPDNIILNSTATGLRVKVLDFGIAKLRDDTASHLTQTGSVMGTPHYMSPEQCLGEELDNRADIYSVGVVLYEMLCGRVPFNSPISTAVVVQHVNQPPPPLRTINPGISPQMEAAVLHSLAKSREARPQTASALAREVTAAAGGARAYDETQWTRKAAQPFSDQGTDDERTVERRRQISALESPKVSKEMAPTVHLSSVSGPIAGGRSTAGTGAVSTAVALKRNIPTKLVMAALASLLLVASIGVIVWRFSQANEPNANSSANSQPDNKKIGSNETSGARKSANPAPPSGMAYLQGGTFLMGSDDGDQFSKPAHLVTVKPFFIDTNEVTCEQYKECVDAKKCPAPTAWANGTFPAGTARQPVTGVSWDDANAYTRYTESRLPTEEEWEFAARGSKDLKYPWGNSWRVGCANADKEGEDRKGMIDVGSYNCGSPSGANDMIGNAWEWTSSDWAPYPGNQSQFSITAGQKVIRGGSWDTPKESATGVLRAGYSGAGDKTGFRCAKDSP